MGIKVEGHTQLVRHEPSHAIVNTDVETFRLTMQRRKVMMTQRNEINNLKDEMAEIKQLLNNVLEKL